MSAFHPLQTFSAECLLSAHCGRSAYTRIGEVVSPTMIEAQGRLA
jgi:hypothetical protein